MHIIPFPSFPSEFLPFCSNGNDLLLDLHDEFGQIASVWTVFLPRDMLGAVCGALQTVHAKRDAASGMGTDGRKAHQEEERPSLEKED